MRRWLQKLHMLMRQARTWISVKNKWSSKKYKIVVRTTFPVAATAVLSKRKFKSRRTANATENRSKNERNGPKRKVGAAKALIPNAAHGCKQQGMRHRRGG
jgi:hypothetical protein